MASTIDRRSFLAGTAALGALGSLGIGRAFAQESQLTMGFWGSQARAERTFGVVDLFQAQNPGIRIDGEFAGWGDYWTKIATQTSGGNAPDIVQMDVRYLVEYSGRGVLAPLTDYVGNTLDLSQFDPSVIDSGKVGDQTYGVSLGVNTGAELINTAAFEAAGVELPGPTTTYDDLFAIGEAFQKVGKTRVTSDGSTNIQQLENWLRQQGKAMYTPDGELGFTAEDMAGWYQLWADLRAAGVCEAAEEAADTTVDPLTSKRAAMWVQSSNLLIGFQALMPERLALTLMPLISAESEHRPFLAQTSLWAVSNSSQHKDVAAEFINFFVNDPEAGAILGVERGVPSNVARREQIVSGLDEVSRETLDFVSSLDGMLADPPPSPPPASGEIQSSLLLSMSQEVAFGQRTPEDAGEAFVAAANDILGRV